MRKPLHDGRPGWAAILAGYDRRSLGVLGALIACFLAVGITWRVHLYLVWGDSLLLAIWAFMSALLCWGFYPRRDGIRLVVGLMAGLAIEAWGTVTGMWTYFTFERPPLWILPAWPVATISIDRLGRMLNLVFPAGEHRRLWWLLIPPACVLFILFSWPRIGHPSSWLFLGFMLIILGLPSPDRRQDLVLMIAGTGLGFFLEYWGTSRHCWTYYDGQIPPLAAVLAHGLAAVSIQRISGKLAPDVASMATGRIDLSMPDGVDRDPDPVPSPALLVPGPSERPRGPGGL